MALGAQEAELIEKYTPKGGKHRKTKAQEPELIEKYIPKGGKHRKNY